MAKNNPKDTVSEEFVLDRFEEDKAVLILDEQEIILPKTLLPKEAKEGEALVLTIATNEAETKRREATAKEILNEILNIKN
jgi:hypothetical protein